MPNTHAPSERGGRFLPMDAFQKFDDKEEWRTQISGPAAKENKVLQNVSREAMGRFKDYEESLINKIDGEETEPQYDVLEQRRKPLKVAAESTINQSAVSKKNSQETTELPYEFGSQKLPKTVMTRPPTPEQRQTGHGKK